jgi:hypothetical protein
MIYLLFPHGDIGWDDVRVFTSFGAVERLIDREHFAIGLEGVDELTPVWVFQLERGKIERWALTRSPSESSRPLR